MSGADKKKPEPIKEADEPNVRHFETVDFSVSTNSGLSDQQAIPMDAYATQYVDRPFPTDDPSTSQGKNSFPTDIPGFTVESELGRGAFGVVYAARDQLLDRRVAIKKPLISNPAHRQQYIDEARKAVKLDHPSIVPIYQVGMTTNDEPFVVQKLIQGSTLRLMIQNGESRLPIAQVIAIMRQVCLAVDAAHAAGIVHRDLKPENLLVEPDGRVYVADFGLAILEDDEHSKKGREVAGTPLYMSPEQFAGRVEWLDGRSDIWALGVILYELLSGKTPFTGSTLIELKDQIKNKDPRPIHQRDPKIPSAFDAVFRKCCAKNVSDRFASVRELVADLDVIAESLPFLDTVNMMSSSQTGAFKALSSTGSAISSGSDSSSGSLSSRSGNASVHGQSTVRNSFGGSTISQPSPIGKLIVPGLISVALLSVLVGSAWFGKIGPFAIAPGTKPSDFEKSESGKTNDANVKTQNVGTEGPENTSTVVTELTPKQTTQPAPIALPSKPFRVSVDGKGTHESIAKAIADSKANDTITILAGTYHESLVIDKSVKLIGQGVVRIISTEGACIKQQGDSQVNIEKVTIDCQATNFNTIDMQGGRLTLVQCDVFASSLGSYNCVKARANATFVAEKCKFESTVHAAVSGEKTSTITVRDSSFSFSANAGIDLKRIGIQATGAKGIIRNCSFMGPCNGGIDWKDSPDQELTIEGCLFDNCDIGIQAAGCRLVTIKGSVDQPCEIKNSVWGVSIKQSQVDLSMVSVEGVSASNKVAMQITEKSNVNCTDCNFSGCVCGILVNQSSLVVDQVETRDTSFVAVLVDGGSVEGKELNLGKVSIYGLVVLSKGASVKLESLKVDAAIVGGPRITPAVYIASGSIEFKDGIFSNCLCGVFVDPNRSIINKTGFPERRSLIDLIGDPVKIKMTLTPVDIVSDRMTLTKCDHAWIFKGIGTSRIKTIDGDLPEAKRSPQLLGDDLENDLEVNSTDLANFSVVKKSGRK